MIDIPSVTFLKSRDDPFGGSNTKEYALRLLSAFLAVLALACISIGAAAQETEDEEARSQFQRGKELYADGKYVEAATAFQRAYELRPSYKILYNLGQVENENGEYVRAFEAYSRYMEEGGDEIDAERKEKVQAELNRLHSLIGSVRVEGATDDAVLLVDGRREAEAPFDEPVRVKLGDRKIVVKDSRGELFNEIVRVGGGEEQVVSVRALEGPEAEPSPQTDPAAVAPELQVIEDKKSSLKTAGIVTMIVGGAVAIGAGVTGGIALSKKNDLEKDCVDGKICPVGTKDELDGARSMAMMSTVLTVVAGVTVATGVVLTIIGANQEKNSSGVVLSVDAAAAPEGGAVMLGGRF